MINPVGTWLSSQLGIPNVFDSFASFSDTMHENAVERLGGDNGAEIAANSEFGGNVLGITISVLSPGPGEIKQARHFNKAANRTVALDADALLKMDQVQPFLKQGDNLVVTPNVVNELKTSVGITDVDNFLRVRGVTVAPGTPGAAVPATSLKQTLDQVRLHRGNAGDALNFSEAGGINANLFITGDKKAVQSLLNGGTSGNVFLPNSGGTFVPTQALP